MTIRHAYLENRKVLADSGETTVDIKVNDPITGFWIEVRNTNGATNNQDNTPAQNVDAIEVIDGSEVLFSLDGEEALALTAYYLGHIPSQLIEEHPSNSQSLSVFVPFGRFIGDQVYSLNPAAWRNPQVRIKWNFANVNAVGATGFTTGTGRLTVMALIMEGAPSPMGFLSIKQQYTSAGAASGDDYVDLPLDYPYAAILLRAYKTATAIYNVLDDVKLSVDQDRMVPFNMSMADILRLNSMRLPAFQYRHVFHKTDSDTIKTILKHEETLSLVVTADIDPTFGYNNTGVGEGVLYLNEAGSASSTDRQIIANVFGYAPYGCVWLPFGDWQDPGSWLPVQTFQSLRAILTQEAATSTIAVCTVQLRR